MRISEPAAFIMTRRFMLGVKQRAEALRASVGSAPSEAARPDSARSAAVGATS
jgi:hypothetical protein